MVSSRASRSTRTSAPDPVAIAVPNTRGCQLYGIRPDGMEIVASVWPAVVPDPASDTAVGQNGPAAEQVLRLAKLAQAQCCHGVVCSPAEVAMLRREMGPDFDLVVPGIRPAGADAQDQKRIMTPPDAMAAGATALVIGRPITGSADPGEAARAIAESMA